MSRFKAGDVVKRTSHDYAYASKGLTYVVKEVFEHGLITLREVNGTYCAIGFEPQGQYDSQRNMMRIEVCDLLTKLTQLQKSNDFQVCAHQSEHDQMRGAINRVTELRDLLKVAVEEEPRKLRYLK